MEIGTELGCKINGMVLIPIEYKVVVKPDLSIETNETLKACTKSGIYIPKEMLEKESGQQITGVLVSAGSKAFCDFGEIIPKIGDNIYFSRYSGIRLESDDKEEYRLMNDKDIAAILRV